MNLDIIKGKWAEVKEKVSEHWEHLTDFDLKAMQGTFEDLSEKLQKSYGYGKEKAHEEIDAFLKKHGWAD